MLLQPGSRPVPNSPDYVLIRKLGAGAFGEVWHAHGPGRLDVALKFIPNVRAHELRALDAIKSIRHPNLVSVFGAWHKDNCLILAMEICDLTLLDRLAEAYTQNLPGIPLKELLGYMTDAANGLDALNAKQVQHRDVKPANLLLLNGGVKVADFGLAKALENTVASNSGAGTVAYTAPECFKGELTYQSDQYSLAVTYCHLRTGHLLFKGDQAQIMYAHLERKPDLSIFPSTEAAVLARALSKQPEKRWDNCKVFINEILKTAVSSQPPKNFTNSLGMQFVLVPPGACWMGEPRRTPFVDHRWKQKQVEIHRNFYIGAYPVTQGEWTDLMGYPISWFSRYGPGAEMVRNFPDADLKRLPVEWVSWPLAREFASRLILQRYSSSGVRCWREIRAARLRRW
jgi:serine/threonine protein kinase